VAANELGLTNQVPVREIYLTSGRSRRLKIGAQVIELRHVSDWQLILPGRPAGVAIRALAWLGSKRARGGIRAIGQNLPTSEINALLDVRARLPTWMAQVVSALPSRQIATAQGFGTHMISETGQRQDKSDIAQESPELIAPGRYDGVAGLEPASSCLLNRALSKLSYTARKGTERLLPELRLAYHARFGWCDRTVGGGTLRQ
jgi:hypothetical protein